MNKFACIPLLIIITNIALSVTAKSYTEDNKIVSIEGESFASQHLDSKRRWFIVKKDLPALHLHDADVRHLQNASGDAYIEILPDTRTHHGEALIKGENFSNKPGKLGVLSYPVLFENPGRYYLWVRAFSTGTEDNGVHVGLNGNWPESGQRVQLCEGKYRWTWTSAQRRTDNHCGTPNTLWLDIPSPGVHTLQISMREDGFELDKFLLTQDAAFVPKGMGPTETRASASPFAEKTEFIKIDHYQYILTPGQDFTPAGNTDQNALYIDKDRKAFAIKADKPEFRNQLFAATANSPTSRAAVYDLVLVTLAEIDGESEYQVRLNGKTIGRFTNPQSDEDYQEVYFRIPKVRLKPDDRIDIASNAVTNGKIPEGDGTAFARGRWRGLVVQKSQGK